MSQPPLITCLPEEMVEIIISELVIDEEEAGVRETMKSLSLVHPRFAYSSAVCSRLFKNITVRITPEEVETIRKGASLQRVMPFVRTIKFRPVDCNWEIAYGRLRTFMAAYTFHNGDDHIRRESLDSYREAFGHDQTRRLYPSHAALQRESDAHHNRANIIRQLYQTGDLRDICSSLLQCFPRVDSMEIMQVAFDGVGKYAINLPSDLKYLGHLMDHHSEDMHSETNLNCLRRASPLNNAFVMEMFGCLSMTGQKIKTLQFNCNFGSSFSFKDDPRWTNLSLTGVENLHWSPQNDDPPHRIWVNSYFQSAGLDAIRRRMTTGKAEAEALTLLAQKCSETLVNLCGKTEGLGGPWPTQENLCLPKLKTISFSGEFRIHASHFARMIDNAKDLECIFLGQNCRPGGCNKWNLVLEAVRRHRNKVEISCYPLLMPAP
ncbi:hypothetical protein MYU51_014921 [Penicillium brevicompactum]|uniref:uncharacterized protein n=1 Tax=Penicillium brevicompactum TaxID=5074 RepID=UPI002541BB7E|nr:uncharacterized protein N7506_004196 [Penicillium brevicompactum]KAJ5336174.1 hypothetical protein N7506_004196 [Penicillium brevicompactum]